MVECMKRKFKIFFFIVYFLLEVSSQSGYFYVTATISDNKEHMYKFLSRKCCENKSIERNSNFQLTNIFYVKDKYILAEKQILINENV